MRIQVHRLSILLFIGAATAAYGAAKITFTPSEPRIAATSKDPSCKIELLDDLAEGDYAELGIINYHNEWHRTSSGDTPAKAMPQIQKRACQVGADAIMNVQVTERKVLEFALLNVRATAIRIEPKNQ